MATYLELYNASGQEQLITLEKQIIVATIIKANALAKLANNTVAQRSFALAALADPKSYLVLIKNYILADYNTQTITAISNATDLQVQTAVNAAVDTLLGV